MSHELSFQWQPFPGLLALLHLQCSRNALHFKTNVEEELVKTAPIREPQHGFQAQLRTQYLWCRAQCSWVLTVTGQLQVAHHQSFMYST